VRFLSLEPLLGPLPRLGLGGIDWVIAGGESGPGARPMERAWVRDVRDRCLAAGVPFFFKQWGGVRKKKAGRTLDGRTWDDMPAVGEATSTTEPRLPASCEAQAGRRGDSRRKTRPGGSR
jgi:protein gp37